MNTKTTFIAILAIVSIHSIEAQTNTFPSTGNVGIGTNNPDSPLEVKSTNSTIRINDSLGSTYSIQSTSGIFRIYDNTATAERIRINADGKVGVGTNNPEAALHIVTSTANSTDNSIRIYAPNIGPYNSHIHYGTRGDWYIRSARADGTVILQDTPGNVGIGTTSPDHKLDVNGTIRGKEVIVETGWSDFVFEENYYLRTLTEVEAHIAEHGHLPDVPSAAVVESEGLAVGEAQKIMMQKIEELTLYMIDLKKENEALRLRVAELETD